MSQNHKDKTHTDETRTYTQTGDVVTAHVEYVSSDGSRHVYGGTGSPMARPSPSRGRARQERKPYL